MTPPGADLIFTKVAFKPLRTNLFHIVLSATFLTLCLTKSYAQSTEKPLPPDSTKIVLKPKDTTPVFLTGIAKRKAKGYERMNQKKKLLTLYDEAELFYEDMELKAGIIVMDYEKNEVYAGRIKDSTGKLTQRPYFKQGGNIIEPDSIKFNTKNKKALIWNSQTKQSDVLVLAEKTKRENDSTYFMGKARFTTSENADDPEYWFQTSKAKMHPKSKVVVGPTNLWIYGVPLPIGVPFAFFPMTSKAQSGLILPTPGDTQRRGYFLQNGGYYFALTDNYDLTFLGDYYTNGSYALRLESTYAWRYRFLGNVNIRFENQVNSERGFPDYSRSKEYNIQWSHSQDGKSNPNSRFSASVNLGSSTYFQNSLNQVNVGSRLNNTLSSSVSYSRTFTSVPQVNIALTATHSQNTQTKAISMTLPTFTGSVDRVFPFAKEDEPKKGIIKNINFQYNVIGENRINTTDSLFFKPEMFRDALSGLKHSIPLSTNFKIAKYFSVPLSVNYNEVWTFKTFEKKFDLNTNKVVTTDVAGFDAYRTYSFSTGVGTTIYGTFNFGKDKKIQAIRHIVKPTVSYSYQPSFSKYYDTYATDATGNMRTQYSRFDGTLYGAPGKSNSNFLGFNINNTFEAKVTDRDTTKVEPRKVMLLNSLNLQTSYDLSADSLKLAPLRISGGTTLFKDKMNVNFATTLDPYAIDKSGRRIDRMNSAVGGSFFRMTSSNITMNYSFSSRDESTKETDPNDQSQRNGGRDDDLFGKGTDLSDQRQSQFDETEDDKDDITEFFKTKLPFDLTMAYSLTYSNANRESKITTNSIMTSANVDLGPKWKIGISSGYDFVQKGITFTQFRFERDLLSWRMDFTWVPLGDYSSWGFFIGIKSGMFSDIKWEKRKSPDSLVR